MRVCSSLPTPASLQMMRQQAAMAQPQAHQAPQSVQVRTLAQHPAPVEQVSFGKNPLLSPQLERTVYSAGVAAKGVFETAWPTFTNLLATATAGAAGFFGLQKISAGRVNSNPFVLNH